jgi:hypothetical protein
MKAMYTQKPLEGYLVEESALKKKTLNGLMVLPIKGYRGQSLYGEILEVSNRQKTQVDIIEQDFYKPGIRAVSISNKTLPPKEKTLVYVVRENG